MNETKACKKCGIEYPATDEYFNKNKTYASGIINTCKKCSAEYGLKLYHKYADKYRAINRNRRKENLDVRKQQEKEYRDLNKERVTAIKKKYRDANKDLLLEKNKQYHKENITVIRQKGMQYYLNNRERCLAYSKQYEKENRERYNNHSHCYRARKTEVLSTFTLKEWEECKNNFNNQCAYCGSLAPLTREHFIPLSEKGEYTKENILPACKSCNSSKGDRAFSDWYSKQPFYSKQREQIILDYLVQDYHVEQIDFNLQEA